MFASILKYIFMGIFPRAHAVLCAPCKSPTYQTPGIFPETLSDDRMLYLNGRRETMCREKKKEKRPPACDTALQPKM